MYERNKKVEEELQKEVSQMFIHVVDFTWFPPGGDLAGGEIVVQNVWFLIRGPVQADAHCRSWRAGGGIAKVFEIDVVLNLIDWGWMINGWPMMIHEVMVVDEFDDGGGGYYIDFSEVGLILFDFTWWSCSFWLLVLNVELDLLGITKMMFDGSKSNSRWCFSTPSVLKSGSFCMFVSDCIRYWFHVDELVGLSVLLQWQGETTFSEARRQTRWYLFMFFVCKIWWLFDR